jgi:hypothetical protein
MICLPCHGTGSVKPVYIATSPKPRSVYLPCVKCNGTGIVSCCEVYDADFEGSCDGLCDEAKR